MESVYENLAHIEHFIPKSRALTCCYNRLHSSGKAFHNILELRCRDLLPVGVPVHPKGVWMRSRSGLCLRQFSSTVLGQTQDCPQTVPTKFKPNVTVCCWNKGTEPKGLKIQSSFLNVNESLSPHSKTIHMIIAKMTDMFYDLLPLCLKFG